MIRWLNSTAAISLALLIALPGINTATAAEQLPIIGWIESVRIQPDNLVVNAKIDTGADHSSIDVQNLTSLSRDNQTWVRFTITNNSGESRDLERPLQRYARVKRKDADSVRRPVVSLDICLAGTRMTIPVNLQARQHFKYRMLIGRSALKDRFLVDSGTVSSQPPACEQ